MTLGLDGDWYEEQLELPNGRSMRIKITKVLESHKSKYQQIDVYETQSFGKMLVLDGIVQLTEADESGYHEMIVHVPMSVHPNVKRVAIIGGGDGGAIREVLKHSTVEHIDHCDLDEDVLKISKKHFPAISKHLDDPKVHFHAADGAAFLKEKKNTYDLIIVDSSDPIGPAESLFEKEFFQTCNEALQEEGILITQAESIFYHMPLIEQVMGDLKDLFPIVDYYHTMIPTYPSGMIGFSFSSKKHQPLSIDSQKIPTGLKYYTEAMHRASFVLPAFAQHL